MPLQLGPRTLHTNAHDSAAQGRSVTCVCACTSLNRSVRVRRPILPLRRLAYISLLLDWDARAEFAPQPPPRLPVSCAKRCASPSDGDACRPATPHDRGSCGGHAAACAGCVAALRFVLCRLLCRCSIRVIRTVLIGMVMTGRVSPLVCGRLALGMSGMSFTRSRLWRGGICYALRRPDAAAQRYHRC